MTPHQSRTPAETAAPADATPELRIDELSPEGVSAEQEDALRAGIDGGAIGMLNPTIAFSDKYSIPTSDSWTQSINDTIPKW